MDKKIPVKNYLIVFAVVLVTVFIVLYVNVWINAYKESKVTISPLVNNISEINGNELNVSLNEMNETILYVGYNGNSEVKNFEKQLLKRIKNKNLSDNVIYYNITSLLDNDEGLNVLRTAFANFDKSINKAPLLIYVKNGIAIEVVDSKEKMLTIDDFDYLIKKYNFTE